METPLVTLPAKPAPPFHWQCVTDAAERRVFIQNYYQVAGNTLPEEYLARALVYQFYRHDQAVAGFILNTSAMNELRYFSYLNGRVRRKMLADENLRVDDMLELCGNYKLKGALTAGESMIYYGVMLSEAYRQARRLGKRWLLGGSVIKKVKDFQQKLMQRVIYHGPVSETMLAEVHEADPLLKLYVIEVYRVPGRTVVVLADRYLLRPVVRFFRPRPAPGG